MRGLVSGVGQREDCGLPIMVMIQTMIGASRTKELARSPLELVKGAFGVNPHFRRDGDVLPRGGDWTLLKPSLQNPCCEVAESTKAVVDK